MWKALLFFPLVLVSEPKPGTKVNLKVTSCTATRIAYAVGNDGINTDGTPVVIDYISAATSYGRVTATINGVMYDSGLYAVYPMPLNLTHVDLSDSAGNHVFLSANYTHWTTLNQSGHNYYVQHWRLDSGTIEFP
jgi:hypothetical protein